MTAVAGREFRYRINEAYVRALAVGVLGLKGWNYIYALRPILAGLIPAGLYRQIYRKRFRM